MKHLGLIVAATLAMPVMATAQTQTGPSVRVAPGQVCADNKCMRFSRDLQQVSIQGRVPVSVGNLDLRSDPVISQATFDALFREALIQRGVGADAR